MTTTEQRRVEPPLAELHRLPTPLTAGERAVLDLLHSRLDVSWEIYIQPFLNGLRPDFVLLNPRNGIVVLEVKDWDLDAMRYFVKDGRLWAERDGRTFLKEKDNPFSAVQRYKEEIYELYATTLPAKSGLRVITAGVVFTRADRDVVLRLFNDCRKKMAKWPNQYPVAGQRELSGGDIDALIPAHRYRNNNMSSAAATELRNWLVEPDVAQEQREPLRFDARQLAFIRNGGGARMRRLKGPAGSGKSVVLAARAARLACVGKRVLVVTYNITLMNYLHDLVQRCARDEETHELDIASRRPCEVEIRHFHGWCKTVIETAGRAPEYDDLWQQHGVQAVLDERMALLAHECLLEAPEQPRTQGENQSAHAGGHRYDAIFVDEGQDYLPLWWNVLRDALRPGGEMLLVADPTQDVYERSASWTDAAMTGAGFRGPWNLMATSYRLPRVLAVQATLFAREFITSGEVVVPEPEPQQELDLYPAHLQWTQAPANDLAQTSVRLALAIVSQFRPDVVAWADVAILVQTIEIGKAVVTALRTMKFAPIHTFPEGTEQNQEEERRAAKRKKLAFFKGGASIKVTTLHSYKGWEGRAVVVAVEDLSSPSGAAAVYAALTRLKRHERSSALSVVCADPRGARFGSNWADPLQMDHSPGRAPLREFAPEWQPLVAALLGVPTLRVVPGRPIYSTNGRELGRSVAEVSTAAISVSLIDRSRGGYQSLIEAEEACGRSALPVHRTDKDLVAGVLDALGC